MDNAKLVKEIEQSQALLGLKNKLSDELDRQMGGVFQFDPFLIIAIISLIIQVIIFCKNRNNDEAAVLESFSKLRSLPPVRTIILRRRLNKLWTEKYAGARKPGGKNPFVAAIYNVSDSITASDARAMFALATKFED